MIKKLVTLVRLFFLKKQQKQQNPKKFIPLKLFDNNAKWVCFVFFLCVNFSFGQITQPTAWTRAYNTNATSTYTGLSFSIAAGSNRILVVAVTTTFTDAGGSSPQADPTITYGGVTLTKATGNGETNGRMHTWLYYLKDNAVMNGTSRPFNVTGGTIQNSALANMMVWYAVYAGVNQSPATYTTGDGLGNGSTASLSAAMAVNVNEQAVYVSSIYNRVDGTTPSYTINSNWTSRDLNSGAFNSNSNTVAWTNQVATRSLPTSNTTDNAVTSTINPNNGGIRFAMSAMSLPSVFIPTITTLGATSGCSGGTLIINGTNFTGATAVTIGGTNVASFAINSPTQISAVIGSGTTGVVRVTTAGGTATSTDSFTVNALPTAPTASAQSFCGSATVASLVASASGNVVDWYAATSGGTALSSGAALSSTTYYAESRNITTGCVSSSRTPVAVTVNPNLPASVSIAASPTGAICSGTSVTFTATPTNQGTAPTYQWRVNGSNVGTNSSVSTFTTTTLANNDIVTVVMTSNASPCLTGSPATSNSVTMLVSSISAGGSVAGSTVVCPGTNSATLTLSGHTGSVTGWESSLDNFATAGTPIANITTSLLVENLTSTTSYRAVVQNGTCSVAYSSAATITVRTAPTATFSLSGTATVCEGTARSVRFNNPHPEGITVTYNINGGTETSVDIAGSAFLDVLASASAGTYSYNLVRVAYQAGGCPTALSGSVSLTVNPTPTEPTIGTTTHVNCSSNTGSVVLENLPSGNWTINQTGHAATSYTGSTSTRTVTGLAAGTYTFAVTNANGCPSAGATVTILDNSNAWNGSSWSKGVPPDDSMNVIIEAVSPISPFTSDLVACALTINSDVVAIVPSGITLTVTNEVTVNGSLTFENNASLVQINDVNNNVGSITYKRNSQAMKNFDFTYWSSPVEGQTLYNLSPNTLWDKYLSFTGDVWKEELGASVMQPGIGYIIRVPKPNTRYPNNKDYWTTASYVQQLEFIGKPNNGHITSSQYFEKDKYYLIGNPYPSAMWADAFLEENTHNDGILGGTIYFWTHNTAIKMVNSKLSYVSDDYASYNLAGGVASAPSDPNNNNVDLDNDGIPDGADNGKKPTGYIGAGQSFFASADGGSGYVEFTNRMRYGGTYNSQFFKPAKTSKSAGFEKNRLWLNLTNTGGAFKQTLIGYIEGATNGYDKSFDGFSFDGNSYIDFYSVNGADNLTIQARALPFNDADLVPLGYRSTIAGDFTIAIDEADGKLATQRVYLEDKQTGTITELTAKNHNFTTKAGTFNNRFVLRYTDKTLGTGDFETTDDSVSVMIQKKTVTVNSTVENIDKVFIYDLSGKHLYTKDKVNNPELIIEHLPFAQQILLVKVVLDNGYETTRKVIFK
ncbi:T9SS sorting signal type C domain-containing protein [Flavobacterium pectinovorum]|uniref:T9SS sorting signal type C domain-containing protein n=1 Tax=Flavobacterium pectinovorum TaxID=29533 RepID=UPI001FAB4809|nr:T9SS sorting signal type C domain-containing protein [Flavobacterium pectinovorum]MCI9844383.1 IPT/TIG domain-containing protein [Flavobacterium pectinovorum]